jgi:hypothetical protein
MLPVAHVFTIKSIRLNLDDLLTHMIFILNYSYEISIFNYSFKQNKISFEAKQKDLQERATMSEKHKCIEFLLSILIGCQNSVLILFSCVAYTFDDSSGRCETFIIGPWSYSRFKSNEKKTNVIYLRENVYGDMP